MNFIEALNQGKLGDNKGLSTGLPPLDRAIDGVQKKLSMVLLLLLK